MSTPETQSRMDTKLQRVAWLSGQDSKKEFNCLMHYFNEESLSKCFQQIDGKKAKGLDGVDKASYGKNLEGNLKELVSRMKRMSYVPGNIKQVKIPKEGKEGSYRPLGISNFEDKLVQKRMQQVLESIYEPIFLSCSYGFRPLLLPTSIKIEKPLTYIICKHPRKYILLEEYCDSSFVRKKLWKQEKRCMLYWKHMIKVA